MRTRRAFIQQAAAAAAAPAAAKAAPTRVRRIDIVHHTHTDIGYTDLPSVVRDKQIRYLDAAIELAGAQPGFRWTIEALIGLEDWWRASSPARRKRLLELIESGRFDVMALPFNQTPLLDALQWKQMLNWIPADLWKQVRPRAAMQNDVNGFPRAGAMLLLDRGISRLLMGINADSGGPPFERPSAFWWKMPDGRKMFVWLGEHYGRAMVYLGFFRAEMPREPDRFLAASHARCLKELAGIEARGYSHSRLLLTFTHPKDYDNGAPYAPLAPFVEQWNAARLQPELRLVTATEAIETMENEVGAAAPVFEGEWTDWWANGSASGPREIAASRVAKRNLAAALSPVWGPMPSSAETAAQDALKDLCLFDEHTWGAAASISAPASLNTLGQYTEKSELSYRAMGRAAWLLDRRAKSKLAPMAEGWYVANPAPAGMSGWVSIPEGRQRKRVWVESLAAHSLRPLDETAAPSPGQVRIETAPDGWPVSALWPAMKTALFEGPQCGFTAGGIVPPANRATIAGLHANQNAAEREALRRKIVRYSAAETGHAETQSNPHTIIYTQELRHPRIANAQRVVEFWRGEPRARFALRFERVSSLEPEVLYAEFALPAPLGLPKLSCGGVPFTPYRDQLKGSCRDYYGIDGWAHYSSGQGHWLWVTRDAPLVSIGGPQMLERRQQEPASPNRIAAILFDNCWHTNFVADSHGLMEFQFDLVWRDSLDRPQDLAAAVASDPLPYHNPAEKEHPALMETLFRP